MPCYGPLTGYRSKEIERSGKRKIVFDPRLSFSPVPVQIPCGQCIGCRLERSRQWAMRLLHERKFHEQSAFLTLTYSNEHLPPGGTLVKRDFQLFAKRYRKYLKARKIKYFMCGEYGERNARPHYHAIVFGHDFADKKYFSANGRGDKYYTSADLSELWPKGHNVIGAVTFDSCAYVARYILKKVNGAAAAEHYAVIDGNGEVYDRLPEYTDQSNGIGRKYYDRFGSEVYTHDSVVINGREVRPPRFYDGLYELTNPKELAKLKSVRKRKALLFKADNTSRRRWVKETIQLKRLKQLPRSV